MSWLCYFKSSTNQKIDDSRFCCSSIRSVITTTATLLLFGRVVYNIFVANLLVSDMIFAVLIFIIQCSMMISYQFGVKLFVSCYAYKFVVLSLLLINNSSILILAWLIWPYFMMVSLVHQKMSSEFFNKTLRDIRTRKSNFTQMEASPHWRQNYQVLTLREG